MTQVKQIDQKQNVVNPLAIGLAGAVVAATTVALMDKDRRKKVGKILHTIREKGESITDQAMQKLDEVQQQANDVKKVVKKAKLKAHIVK